MHFAGTTWPAERDAALKRFWADGLPASEIKTRLGGGLTRSAVLGRARRLGLSRVKAIAATKPRAGRTDNAGSSVQRVRGKAAQSAFSGIVQRVKQKRLREDDDEPEAPSLPKELPADAIPIAQRKQLVDLDNEHCRFPYNDPLAPDFFFCGDPSADHAGGRPYCRFHTDASSCGGASLNERAQRKAASTKAERDAGSQRIF